MDYFDTYITLIIVIKVIFVILAIYRVYIKRKKPDDKKLLEKIEFWKGRVEFVFIFMMSTLLIYLFNPRSNNTRFITSETKLLLYLFGFILVITANWSIFIKESPLLKDISSSFGNEGST